MATWVAIRSIPEEGCDGWWIKAQPHAALRGFTHDIAWVNGGDENLANARLIAAAPDLLAALREYVRDFGSNEDSDSKRMAEKARAAIAAAEPQS